MQDMIEHASYMAHGYCLLWQPWLVTLWAGSDLLIFLSYLAIPIALVLFLRRRPDIRYRGLVSLFAAFILLCGLTHALSIVTLWFPIYPLVGVVKLMTGLVSAATAVVLFSLIPKLVKIPSPDQLQSAIERLEAEAAAHRATLDALEDSRADLERKVSERTSDLVAANEKLTMMTREAVHRVRNLLTVVSSLARQTARSATDTASFVDSFSGRIQALANATAQINTRSHTGGVNFRQLVEAQLEPVLSTFGSRISIEGPELVIDAEAAQQFGLALHELGTNAVKYGALAGSHGAITLQWSVSEEPSEELLFRWSENGTTSQPAESPGLYDGGDPDAAASESGGGFGTRLLTTAVPGFLHGAARHELTPGGLNYVLRAPLQRLLPSESAIISDVPGAAVPAH